MGSFALGGLRSASWAPNGRIYLLLVGSTKRKKQKLFAERIISMKADGSARKVILTRVHAADDHSETLNHVDVSPDGNRLILGANTFRGVQSPLELVDLRRGKSKILSPHASGGRWSPDGRKILFESNDRSSISWCDDGEVCHYDAKIFVIRPNGTGLKRVTERNIPGNESGADWSPDGSTIVFSSDRNNRLNSRSGYFDDHNAEIFSVRVDGGCLNWLTNGSQYSYAPVWGPEKNRDFSPASCDDRKREALSTFLPGPWTDSKGNKLATPRLWLGPVFRSLMPVTDYGPDNFNDGIEYRDCALFVRADCGPGLDVFSERQCYYRGYDSDVRMVGDGRFGSLERRRGAVIMRSNEVNDQGVPALLVLTGRQTVQITPDWHFANDYDEADYLELIDGLRPVGAADASAPLEEALFDRTTVNRAAAVDAYFQESESVASTAEKFKTTAESVRSYLRFHDEIERIGPVSTIDCSKRGQVQ